MIIFLLFISMIFSQSESNRQGYLLDENNFIIYEQEATVIDYRLSLKNHSNSILDYYHQQLINRLYKNKNEFFIYLKSEKKYKVLEIIEIDGDNLKMNILKGNLSKQISYKNNISNLSNFYTQESVPKHVKTIKINQILFIENIEYEQEFKDIRNYTLFTIGTIWMLDIFF